MRNLTAKHLKQYSKCPRQTFLSWDNQNKQSEYLVLVKSIIQKVYIEQMKKDNEPLKWKDVHKITTLALETFYLSSVNYNDSKNVMSMISEWYNLFYLDQYCLHEGFINFPIYIGVVSFIFNDNIDILFKNQEDIVLCDFFEEKTVDECSGLKLYNDLAVHAKIWYFIKSTGIIPVKYMGMFVTPLVIKPIEISIKQEYLSKIDLIIRFLSLGVGNEISYPVFSDHCKSCGFKRGCSF